jgi:hypothetical protein
MQVTRVFETVAPSPGEAAQPSGMFQGRAFIGSDRPDAGFSERIVIYEAPPSAAGRVVAIHRTLHVEDGLRDAARESLVGKYGRPNPASIPNRLWWTESPQRECTDLGLDGGTGPRRWQDVAGGATDRRDTMLLYGLTTTLPPTTASPARQTAFPRCGVVIQARMEGGGSGADGISLL